MDRSIISSSDVAIYLQFRGDQDAFARTGTHDAPTISTATWQRIDAFVTQLGQLSEGVLAPAYAARVEETLAEEIPDLSAQAQLRLFASEQSG